jgi:hypothetical protein
MSINEEKFQQMIEETSCPDSHSHSEHPVSVYHSVYEDILPNMERETLQTDLTPIKHWPIKLKLTPIYKPYFQHEDILIAADCVAYAYANFHTEIMKDKVTLITCPKQNEDYFMTKLLYFLKTNDVKSITIAKMSASCCGGLERATLFTIKRSGKKIPLRVLTISSRGHIDLSTTIS